MQIKKSARDTEFAPVPRFESNGYEPQETSEPRAADTFSARRPANPGAAQQGDDQQTAQARTQSVIDRNSSFDGRFETEHDLRIEGTVSGEIVCRGTFQVDREATARVRVQARDGHILGHFEGDIVCAGRLVLASTAVVTGTFKSAVLVVEEGATVSGTVDTTQNASALASSSSAKAAPPAADSSENGSREPATITRAARREPPSFALVASDEQRTATDRN